MKILVLILLILLMDMSYGQVSICYGTTSHGRLENGVRLPSSGPNFVSYGDFPALLGRTYIHSKVRDVILTAYQMLEIQLPGKVFKYAETGFRDGGEFKPHKTHQNGLSVDFMVPVMDMAGKSVHLPTNPITKYGYNIEFDKTGKYGEYVIDFDALGAHLVSLHHSAKQQGIAIWRVLIDPRLQPLLYKSNHGEYIRNNIYIPNKRSWVRHDEHYHVDFSVDCREM